MPALSDQNRHTLCERFAFVQRDFLLLDFSGPFKIGGPGRPPRAPMPKRATGDRSRVHGETTVIIVPPVSP